jgi:hypothetical protein
VLGRAFTDFFITLENNFGGDMKNQIVKVALILITAVVVYQYGVKPMLGRDFYNQLNKENNDWAVGKLVQEKDVYDLIVVGEEPEGIAAAISASRTGAKTLLLSQGDDLGGSICKALYFDMEINTDANGSWLSRGLFREFYDDWGEVLTVEKYKSVMKNKVEGEKNLDTIYGVQLSSPVLSKGILEGVNATVKGKKVFYKGKRFIDATKEGDLLKLCGVPYIVGKEDINLKEAFQPQKLNFMLSNVKWDEIKVVLNNENVKKLYEVLKEYKPQKSNISLGSFKLFPQEDDKVIVQVIEVNGIDVMDEKSVSSAYNSAVQEAERLWEYLKLKLAALKDSRFEKAAESFYTKESVHFLGEHILSVNEALENTDFDDKIALASNAIEINAVNSGYQKYIVGKPNQYSIPLGCLIPLKVDNLLMAGGKISYSSIVSSSANCISVNINTGESAAVAAVYSLVKNITPREIVKTKDVETIKELGSLLRRQGIYLPLIKLKNPAVDNWAYTSVRQLNTLGLISAGYKNQYNFDKEAVEKDLATLMLNGVYRLSPDKYSLALDTRIRPYFTSSELTREKAAEILLAFYGIPAGKSGNYQKACSMGYINNAMNLRLRDQKILTMDQVYELSAYNIKLFTGKQFKD